ncbi:MAG: hypothetical protein OXB97_04145 [Rhodospirillales bacterium]|nr:hypothetical protein [Rhodospirillales bacterium]
MTQSRARRRLLPAALAALLLAATATAGFPTFDVAAFGQRVQKAINDNAQLAGITSLVTNTTTMISTLDSQLDQAFQFAEGRIGALANWNAMFPAADVLGAPAQVQGWITRAGQIRNRAARLAAGSLGALPTEADVRGAWAAAPVTTPIGTPVVHPPAETRADLGARLARERVAVFARLDAITSARAAAAERHAQLADDIRGRLEGIAADPGVSATALQQKQISVAAAHGDLMAAQLQVAALREELVIEEAATRREAAAAYQAAKLNGIRAAFDGTAAIMARYDDAGADTAFTRPQLPVY